ncbi:MAG TPA: OsmC family protein [Anaerolineaceae bacterium]|jgi:putative redox protein|nr:OsmC family protein [Anaerolineaceae bacterium]
MLKVKTTYAPHNFTLETDRAILKFGSKEGEFFPYDLFLGSLSSCFYYTLMEIYAKRRMDTPAMEIIVTGDKRKEVPTTLEWVEMDITVFDEVDEDQFSRFVDLASKYCSIHATISQVAEITHKINFKQSK